MSQHSNLWNIQPGERGFVRIPVTVDLGGHEVVLPVHVIRGCESGPTLTLLSCLHGNEWLSIAIVRRILDRIDPQQLRGNVVAVTVGNPVALTFNRRSTPDDSDSPDLNRSFGRPWFGLSEQLARTLSEEVFSRSDYIIDFHPLGWGCAFGVVIFGNDFDNSSLNQETDQLARVFGYPMLAAVPLSSSTASGHAGEMDIPSITVEIGGAGFSFAQEEEWINQNVAGTFNVLHHYGFLSGDVNLPDQYYYWGKRWRVAPTKGGYLYSNIGPERLLTQVEADEKLGYIRSPHSLEIIEVLRAPAAGLLYSIARSYPVRPGEWAFGVADLDTLTTFPSSRNKE